ncbi:NAD(P)-binding protein [Clavulina sp. PMI_390]|nr:NAD(P)-binding protein [Clavulina sp. PMI_390]
MSVATASNLNAKGSVIVITGGSSGIGLAVAKVFLSQGAKGVVISGRSKGKLDAAVAELLNEAEPKANSGVKRVLGVASDVTSWEETQALMKTAFDTYHQLDYVFANATGTGSDFSPSGVFAKPSYEATYSIIQSVANTVHAAARYLAAPAGGAGAIKSMKQFAATPDQNSRRDKGIVITGSASSFVEYDLHPQYGAAKAAVNSFVWTNKSRLAKVGIRINCVAPAWVDTPLLAPMKDLGIILPQDIIPMEVVTGAVMRFFNDSTISGVITSIPVPSPDVQTFDVVASPLAERFQMEHCGPLFAKAAAAAKL